MIRAPVCHYYQAGNCRNGDECTFFHPQKKCRNFVKTGWCPFGYNCHYWHDSSKAADNTDKPIIKTCQFFMNNQCKYGESCSLSHDLSSTSKTGVTLDEYKAMKSIGALTLSRDSSTVSHRNAHSPLQTSCDPHFKEGTHDAFSTVVKCSDHVVTSPFTGGLTPKKAPSRPVFERPHRSSTNINTTDVTDSDINRLQHLEIDRLLKYFAKDNIKEGGQTPEGRIFFLQFSSTDPDWAYSVREVQLNIHIDSMYPKRPLKVIVSRICSLPSILVEHMNSAIATWINSRHELLQKSGRLEIYLRPFLQWLDRHLENLFTQGLRKFKAELLSGRTDSSTRAQPLRNADHSERSSSCESSGFATDRNSNSYGSDSEIHSVASRATAAECHHSIEGEGDDELGEWVEPVVSCSTADASTTKPTIAETHLPDKALTSSTAKLPATQNLRLADLRLLGSAGVYIQNRIFASMHCIKCRLAFSWYFNFHGNLPPSKSAPENETIPVLQNVHLRSLQPHSINCARCRAPMKLYFQASVAHAHDNFVGAFHLAGCVVDDIPFGQSMTNVLCTGCNKYIKVKNLTPNKGNSRRCFVCHTVVGLEFNRFLIESKVVGATILPSESTFSGSVTTDKPSVPRRLRRAVKEAHSPVVKDGEPLPLYGTCEHYRKSYRWLRFPCCGLLQPCDVCHDKATGDSHKMEMATRMVCGFCSKEQAFSSTQPCVRCGKRPTGSRSAHWEGGKGCRNKVTMSRKDAKKYSQENKTVPKNSNKK